MNPIAEHYPRINEFLIGETPDLETDDPTLVGIIWQPTDIRDPALVGVSALRGRIGPFFGLVENFGSVQFTFEVLESSNNESTVDRDGTAVAADTYSAINIRVDGADVASVDVVAGGKVAFAIEGTFEDYLRFQATAGGLGRLVLTHFGGDVQRRERKGVL